MIAEQTVAQKSFVVGDVKRDVHVTVSFKPLTIGNLICSGETLALMRPKSPAIIYIWIKIAEKRF